jgi:glutathione peroxidase
MFLTILVALSALLSPPAKNIHDYSFKSIDGKTVKLSDFKGKKKSSL